jgi:hypothetical protein
LGRALYLEQGTPRQSLLGELAARVRELSA